MKRDWIRFLIAEFVVAVWYLTACAPAVSTEAPTSTPALVSSATPTPEPSATSAPASPVTPSRTQVPRHIVEPLVTAKRLRFDSWSPDGEWIAYWFGQREERPAQLAFVDPLSGQVCQHEDVLSGFWDGYVVWQVDSRAIAVIDNRDAFGGTPCGEFALLDKPAEVGRDISPDGRYSADTRAKYEEQTVHNVTTILDTTTGEAVTTISWDASIHALQRGPRWLNNDVYLIGQTLDRGLLYVSVTDGRTGSVVTDLLKLETPCDENLWFVFTHTNPATGEYHILLEWWGGPMRSPLLLYHGELDRVEELPFNRAWPFDATDSDPYGFSPDGEWLLAGNPINEERPPGTIGEDYWLRPVDPPGSKAFKLAEGLAVGALSSQTQKMAFYDRKDIYIYNFPDGEVLGRWVAGGYALMPTGWSPDGIRLTAIGLPLYESARDALFVIEP